VEHRVSRWRAGLASEGLVPGDLVAMSLPNGLDWVCFDLAALGLGLVTVPLYATDSPGNLTHILADSGARLLLLDSGARWGPLAALKSRLPRLQRVLCQAVAAAADDPAVRGVDDWLPQDGMPGHPSDDPDGLATLVYTSGTTGPAKGVMLSHRNILSNAEGVLRHIPARQTDVFLSFLPLAHAFERTVGYYLPMMAGSTVAFSRSVDELAEDLLTIRPTMLVSVPRIYERVYARLQHGLEMKGALARTLFNWAVELGWRRFEASQQRAAQPGLLAKMSWPLLRHLVADKILSRLGGRLRLAISGGAPLSPKLSHCFIGLGLPLLQGYGLTEASPIVTANTLRSNVPESVGVALPGVELRLGDHDELLVRGPNLMLGYWNDPDKTRESIDGDGWLHTGDVARIEADGHVFIVGRLKEILVMSTGEKVPPSNIELAISEDPLFDQAMVIGEGKPYLAALVVLNREAWSDFARALEIDPADPDSLEAPAVSRAVRERIESLVRGFPSYAKVREVWLTLEPWTIENALVTPTLKLKRPEMERRFASQIANLYAKSHI